MHDGLTLSIPCTTLDSFSILQIAGQLAGTDIGSLEGKFKALEGDSKVEDELQKMKNLLPGQKERVLLPPNQTVDLELERLRQEMGRD